MDAFGISGICVFISSLTMGIFMLIRSSHNRLRIIWGVFCIVISNWGFSIYQLSTTSSYETAFIWCQIGWTTVVLAPVLYYQWVYEYLSLKNPRFLITVYIFALIFLALIYFKKDFFLADIKFMFNEFYYHDWTKTKNPVYLCLYVGFYWLLLPYTFSLLIKEFFCTSGQKRNQLKYFILGAFSGWIGAHLMYLMEFGINIYPYSNFGIAIYPLFMGYAMVKHQLMDINIVFKKGLLYSILITFLSLIYLISVLFFEGLFQKIVGYQTAAGSISASIVIAIIFIPLRNALQKFIDHIFYQGTPDEIAHQNELLRREVAQSEKLKAVATLASGMAHEIKNPLTAIQTFTEYLPERQNDPEFLNKFSTIVGKEVNRINDLVHQLLDFAKPSPLTLRPTNIHTLLDEIVDFLNNEFLKKNISIIKTYNASQHKDIPADANKLKQAFLNILLNAIEACPNGGRIEISTANPNPEEIEICISDNGPGIDEKNLKYIFDPFFTTKDHGTGLGLSIVQGIVKDHGGKIVVKNSNKKTIFSVTLIWPYKKNNL